MKNERSIVTVAAMLWIATLNVFAFERGEAELHFIVADEDLKPVTNATVRGGAWWPERETGKDGVMAGRSFRALTDTNGCATVHVIVYSDVKSTVEKDGYYTSRDTYDFYLSKEHSMKLDAGQWLPRPSVKTVTLKRILNPIPMYARRVNAPVPALDTPVGYDLEKGDWVSPHGKGVVSDLVVTASGRYVDNVNRDIQMVLHFPLPGAGIITNIVPIHNEMPIGSQLVSDHTAPAEGYRASYEYSQRMRPKLSDRVNMTPRFGQIAYFRVRTELDDKGQVKKAWHGKMYGDLYSAFDFDKRICLIFTYYLNPDGTRNVEFDLTRNLLTDLKSLEQVNRP
ncbi:MAG: hypothetical protein R6X19_01710 [Kiritimatiellia bacterium]